MSQTKKHQRYSKVIKLESNRRVLEKDESVSVVEQTLHEAQKKKRNG
ncbi:hypothetical protein GCM10008986_09180 [Salinibacillus aidingensis]|uniref:Fur-regulated basic protein B n=1 Tax=Salinibacillus aidingensis TaxID=237684 RepID=A0ABN1AXJ8_9BACI